MVVTSSLGTDAVTAAKIKGGGVSHTNIAADAISAAQILGGTIVNSSLGADAVSFGGGTHTQAAAKMNAHWVSVLTGASNASVAVTHGLGRTPIGIFCASNSKGSAWYSGSTAHSATKIYIRTALQSVAFKFLVV